jgi:hypothetical protein
MTAGDPPSGEYVGGSTGSATDFVGMHASAVARWIGGVPSPPPASPPPSGAAFGVEPDDDELLEHPSLDATTNDATHAESESAINLRAFMVRTSATRMPSAGTWAKSLESRARDGW